MCFVFLLISTLMQFNNGHYFSEFTFTENEGCVWKWGTNGAKLDMLLDIFWFWSGLYDMEPT